MSDEPKGLPYTIREAELVCERHAMDEYHRELMRFLIADVRRLRALIAEVVNGEWDDLEPDDGLHQKSARARLKAELERVKGE